MSTNIGAPFHWVRVICPARWELHFWSTFGRPRLCEMSSRMDGDVILSRFTRGAAALALPQLS